MQVFDDAKQLELMWASDPRWAGITRPYSGADVVRLRGSVPIDYTLARLGAERLWKLLQDEPYVAALGAVTGNQAVQAVKAGLKAIYLSGWQVAATRTPRARRIPTRASIRSNSCPDAGRAHQQRASSAPTRFRPAKASRDVHWFAPIVADAEAGFGGALKCTS